MPRPVDSVPGFPPPAQPEEIAELPDDVVDALTAYTVAETEDQRREAVRRLSRFESTLRQGQRAFFRLKAYTVLATPFVLSLERELATRNAPGDPNELAVQLINAPHEEIGRGYGQTSEWLVRGVTVKMTYETLAHIYQTNLDKLRQRDAGIEHADGTA